MRKFIIAACLFGAAGFFLASCRGTVTVRRTGPRHTTQRTTAHHMQESPPPHRVDPHDRDPHYRSGPSKRTSVRFTYSHAAQGGRSATITVRKAPPSPRRETRYASPGRGYVWVDGYYMWNGRDFVWVRGRWIQPRYSGKRWVSGKWKKKGDKWVWSPGKWK